MLRCCCSILLLLEIEEASITSCVDDFGQPSIINILVRKLVK